MSSQEAEPTPPIEPEADDCCGSGCVRCVFDIHEEATDRYREALAIWRKRQLDSGDPKRNT